MVLLPALVATRALMNRFRDAPVAAARHAANHNSQKPNVRQMATLRRYEHAQKYVDRATLSTSSSGGVSKQLDPQFLSEDEWKPIYRFNQITKLMTLSRIKIAQTALTVSLVPITGVSLSSGLISGATMAGVTGAASLACVMLYLISYWVMRVVGVISVNSQADTIRVGHLSFWGGRRNKFISVDDVTPLSELRVANRDVYTQLRSIQTDQVMLMPLVGVTIPDRQAFEEVFGKFDPIFAKSPLVEKLKKLQ